MPCFKITGPKIATMDKKRKFVDRMATISYENIGKPKEEALIVLYEIDEDALAPGGIFVCDSDPRKETPVTMRHMVFADLEGPSLADYDLSMRRKMVAEVTEAIMEAYDLVAATQMVIRINGFSPDIIGNGGELLCDRQKREKMEKQL